MEPDDLINQYLEKELNLSETQALIVSEKIRKYDDIYQDFCKWLQTRNYDYKNPLVVNGYTAKQIFELNPKLDGIGIYNFLITIRENHDVAMSYIKSGFPEA